MTMEPSIPLLVMIPDDSGEDYAAIYAIATAYAHSGLLVSEYGKKNNAHVFTFPAVVCSSLAIELFMKFFIVLENSENPSGPKKNSTGHKLKDLWFRINADNQLLIAGMFRNKSRQPMLKLGEIQKEAFEKALEDVGDSPFLRWRYAYEIGVTSLISHASIVEVLDALGLAAEYVMNVRRQ